MDELIPVREDWNVQTQSLDAGGERLLEGVYSMYERFRQSNREYREEIVEARRFCALKDDTQVDSDGGRRTVQLSTLNSTIDNMMADYLDNMPEGIATPERKELWRDADDITDVLRWMLHHSGYRSAWRMAIEDAVKCGTGVLQVLWDEDAEPGEGQNGMPRVLYWPSENWLPDPAYDDYRDGRAVFKVSAHPYSYFTQRYPKECACIMPDGMNRLEQDAIRDTYEGYGRDPVVALIECWYRVWDDEEKTFRIHMAQVAGGALLYDSRREYPNGLYAHGRYPFVTLRFRERRNTAYGTGMVYEFGDTQRMINRLMRYMDDNARASSKPKLLLSKSMGIDKKAATDYNATVVEMDQVRADAMQWFQAAPLNSQVQNMLAMLQDMEKQDSGQNQFNRGEGGLGVTAASAISMLQEAGGKIARMHIASFNDSFRELAEQMLLLASEFFEEERIVLITGEDGLRSGARVVAVSGKKLRGGTNTLLRNLPFKVRVQVQAMAPSQVVSGNNAVKEILTIAGQSGSVIPASMVIRLIRGIPNKDELIDVVDSADAMVRQVQEQAQTIEELQQQLAQLSQNAANEIQRRDDEIAAARKVMDQFADRHVRVSQQEE